MSAKIKNIFLILIPGIVFISGCTHHSEKAGLLRIDLNRAWLFSPVDSFMVNETTEFVDDYADTFILTMSMSRQERQDQLHKALRNACLCNACSCHAKDEFRVALSRAADSIGRVIRHRLGERAIGAYDKEREALVRWHSFFTAHSNEALNVLWWAIVGGTSGMTWFTGREYDIADLDYEDQNSLLEAMEWKRYLKPDSKPLHDDARLDAWVPVRCKQCRVIISSNTDTDGVVRLDHKYTSEEELYAVCVDLRQDMVLFKDWMARRRELEKLLPKRVRKTYSEMTERIIQNRLSFGQELGEW